MRPRATYRVQLSRDFTFDDAAAIAGQLSKLGISHLYASPCLTARPGSEHGYDLIDPTRLNPELGGDEAFERLSLALKQHSLGLLLDFIPNHMGVGGSDNRQWLDVLEWGPDSRYAGWFDIHWDAGKLLIPILGNQYGVEVEKGELELVLDADKGEFAVWAYRTHKLPICPLSYEAILGVAHPTLERLGDAFAHLPGRSLAPSAAADLKAELAAQLATDSEVSAALQQSVHTFRGVSNDWSTWRALDALIQRQHWRPAYFRVAADDINYRRFFNINELAGIRMENPEVFEYTHARVFDLMRAGKLDGLRIDHIDGLYDPKAYLTNLSAKLQELSPDDKPYLVVEKILAPHENLREDWPVSGTTGYEFAAQVTNLMIHPDGESPLTQMYTEFCGTTGGFPPLLKDSKRQIIDQEMTSELARLAAEAALIATQNPRTRDFTRNLLFRALEAIVLYFPVYRIYVDTGYAGSAEDRRDLHWAIEQARAEQKDIDPTVFDFLQRLLSGDLTGERNSGFSRTEAARFAMRFQQYTGPVMAKGLEDTALYRYNRLIALNEVGCRPDQFGLPPNALHKANAFRAARWPDSMLALSTHDTKFGEDVRARLAVLSEIPDEWSRKVRAWTKILRAPIGGTTADAPPSRNDEYFLYQLLLGTWPPQLTLPNDLDPTELSCYANRVRNAMTKVIREAKLHTSWIAPDQSYESGVMAFIDRALSPDPSNTFLAQFRTFQRRVARLGVENSLLQTTLKLTCPGVPDIYQGSELWNLNMMDPDNRSRVDFALRQQFLERMKESQSTDVSKSMQSWHDGRIKLHVTTTLLSFRREHPELFAQGEYHPVSAAGARADYVFAFERRSANDRLIIAGSRFPASRPRENPWGDTLLPYPADEPRAWRDLLTARTLHPTEQGFSVAQLFQHLPVVALIPELQRPPSAPSIEALPPRSTPGPRSPAA